MIKCPIAKSLSRFNHLFKVPHISLTIMSCADSKRRMSSGRNCSNGDQRSLPLRHDILLDQRDPPISTVGLTVMLYLISLEVIQEYELSQRNTSSVGADTEYSPLCVTHRDTGLIVTSPDAVLAITEKSTSYPPSLSKNQVNVCADASDDTLCESMVMDETAKKPTTCGNRFGPLRSGTYVLFVETVIGLLSAGQTRELLLDAREKICNKLCTSQQIADIVDLNGWTLTTILLWDVSSIDELAQLAWI